MGDSCGRGCARLGELTFLFIARKRCCELELGSGFAMAIESGEQVTSDAVE